MPTPEITNHHWACKMLQSINQLEFQSNFAIQIPAINQLEFQSNFAIQIPEAAVGSTAINW